MTTQQLLLITGQLNERRKKVEADIQNILNELEEIGTYENIDDVEDLAQLETLNDADRALLKRLQEEKRAIEKALVKIKEGTYGKCSDGSEIPFEKLQADPLYEC